MRLETDKKKIVNLIYLLLDSGEKFTVFFFACLSHISWKLGEKRM